MKKSFRAIIISASFFIFVSMGVFTFAQPQSLITSPSAGWDIYSGGIYRYGPSIMINSDNSIDAWCSTPGTNEYVYFYELRGTHSGVVISGTNTAAQKFTANWNFCGVDVCAASWGNSIGNLTLKLYRWNTNYATSIAGTPIVTRTFVNYADNQWLSLDFETQNSGDYIWVASNPVETVGVWKDTGSHYGKNVAYFNGNVVTGDYNFRIVDSADHYTSNSPLTSVQLTGTSTAAQKFTTANSFDAIGVQSCSFANNIGNLTVKLFSWNTNYQTTIAGTPIATKQFVNFFDNSFLKMYFQLQPAGSYLWVINGATENVGLWKLTQGGFPDNINYLNGAVTTGEYKTRVFEYTWDTLTHRRSTDGGVSWGTETTALKSSPGTRDAFSACDPGVIKIGSYYYMGYTSTEDTRGTANSLYIARSTSPIGPYEKWNGSGWGGNPQPMVTYTGPTQCFGAGEPSFVLKDSTIYIYYTWNDQTANTMVATANANDPNWPGALTQQGPAFAKVYTYDSLDVKYIDAYGKFIGVCIGNRLNSDSFVAVYESLNGIDFVPAKVSELTQNIKPYSHNVGISGTPDGHINLNNNNFIAYAYGQYWACWNTALNPITITKYVGADIGCIRKANADEFTQINILDRYTNFATFSLEMQLPLGETNNGSWDFVMADYNHDGIKDLYCILRSGGTNKTEVHILDGASDYQTYLMHTATALDATDADWSFSVADYNNDGTNDLFCINKAGDSGPTEMHILNGANNFAGWLYQGNTGIGTLNSTYSVLVGKYDGDTIPDLYIIQRVGGSNTTEVHILDGASNYLLYSLHTTTVLPVTDSNFEFSLADYDYDGIIDLYTIKRSGTTTEAHILNGANNFQSFILQAPTALPQSDSRWVFSASK